jgi:hypothetical protein
MKEEETLFMKFQTFFYYNMLKIRGEMLNIRGEIAH